VKKQQTAIIMKNKILLSFISILNVVLTESCESRNINCPEPSLLIEGACDSSGNLIKKPRCVEEISEKTTVMLSDQRIHWLTDQNFDSCFWIKKDDILSVQLPKTSSPVKLTLLTRATNKKSLTSSVWSVAISDNAEDRIDHTPHENEILTADNEISSIQWSFHEIGNQILLKLLNERVYLCHIYVHAVANEEETDKSSNKHAFERSVTKNRDHLQEEENRSKWEPRKILETTEFILIICFLFLFLIAAIIIINIKRKIRRPYSYDDPEPRSSLQRDRPPNTGVEASIPLNPLAEESPPSPASSNNDNSPTRSLI